jgi:hypothetical protein
MNIKDPFHIISLFMPLFVDRSMQMYFSGPFYSCQMYLHVLHVLDESGFAYEHPSVPSSERSDQLTDQHSELTF